MLEGREHVIEYPLTKDLILPLIYPRYTNAEQTEGNTRIHFHIQKYFTFVICNLNILVLKCVL